MLFSSFTQNSNTADVRRAADYSQSQWASTDLVWKWNVEHVGVDWRSKYLIVR